MPAKRSILKSIMPVKIYKSTSAVYMTCLSKISVSAFVPECNQKLVVERAIVQALDESIMPQAYADRQREAEELMHRSQTNFRTLIAERSKSGKMSHWGQNTQIWNNNELAVVPQFSAITNQASGEPSFRTQMAADGGMAVKKKVRWGQSTQKCFNKELEVTHPMPVIDVPIHDNPTRQLYRRPRPKRRPKRRGSRITLPIIAVETFVTVEFFKALFLLIGLCITVYLMADLSQ
ncbi:hypothetical protein AWZ03_005259 [Drosophila navojoa]|uniref:Uncharacterized protein n=1 Tax=Drosophila navojoa TaxID=7232 RepID=A0A484BI03_DRONA|nr:uncharacterized protein LOC108652746 [Drosophila navojoa]TDG48304.1 hypothetical protein AWZ03_005259 [Drosophila navojoa]